MHNEFTYIGELIRKLWVAGGKENVRTDEDLPFYAELRAVH
jgi:hypothetical protein